MANKRHMKKQSRMRVSTSFTLLHAQMVRRREYSEGSTLLTDSDEA